MPSDPRVAAAFELLAPAIDTYRSAVAATLEDVRALLATARGDSTARAERMKQQLGAFAEGRVDSGRLAGMLGERGTLGAATVVQLGRASQALLDALEQDLHVTIDRGGDLALAIDRKLASVGRAFAAARIASAARSRIAVHERDQAALDAFPFRRWNGAERRMAPPLVFSVHASDLNDSALIPFVDGSLKLLLIVDGDGAPAPLVRLITPGVLVIQAHSPEDLKTIAVSGGPAVAAWMPRTAARFTHDPAGGPDLWRRMTVHLPAETHLVRVEGRSAAQQRQELLQLEALAAVPRNSSTSKAALPSVEHLTAWLLKNSTADPA